MKRLERVPEDFFLITTDAVGLYPSIPHKEGILALKNKPEEQTSSKILSSDLVKLAEFLLKSSFFENNNKIKQQISVIAIGANFALPYGCIYMNKTVTNFLTELLKIVIC